MKRSILTPLLAIWILWSQLTPAFAISFGSIEQWKGSPGSTISIDDKNFVWLADSANWTGAENVNLAFLPAVNAHGFGIETLETYIGPLTLSVSYRVDITSSNVFAAVGMDQDFLYPTVTTIKDIYYTLDDFDDAGDPGTGTVSLSITDFIPNPFPPVPLDPVQSIWVRDTILITGTGSVQSISNTFIQTVPEPSSIALAALGIGLAAVLPRQLKRFRSAGRGSGLAA